MGRPRGFGLAPFLSAHRRRKTALRLELARLRESERRYHDIFENASECLYLLEVTEDGRFRNLDVNPALVRASGISRADMVGKFTDETVSKETALAVNTKYRRCVDTGQIIEENADLDLPSGRRVFQSTIVPVPDETGRVRRLVGISRDITGRTIAEEELRRQVRLNDAMFDQAISCFFLMTPDGIFTRVNEAYASNFRKSVEDFSGRSYLEFVSAENLSPDSMQTLHEVLRTRKAARVFARPFVFADQPERGVTYWDWILQPVLDEQGNVELLFFSSTDVTERKRADDALRASEQEFRAIFELGAVAQAQGDPKTGRLVRVNRKLGTLLGYSEEELLGMTFMEITYPGDMAPDFESFQRLVRGEIAEYTVDKRLCHKNGSIVWVQLAVTLIRDAEGNPLRTLAVGVDVTERTRAEQALRESEHRYREVFNSSTECIFLLDVMPDGRFQFAELNPATEKALGVSSGEIAHRPIENVFPADLAAEVNANYRRCVEAGTLITYDEELSLPAGRRSFQTNLVPVRDERGRISRIIGIARDITERKEAEVRLRASLREKEALLKEVHHRVKNNLQLISSLLALQAARIDDPVVVGALTASQTRVRAMALVHENLYRTADLASVRLVDHVEALCAHLYRSYGVDPNRIRLELRVADDLALDLDRSIRCGLIINELVSNAIKHGFSRERSGHILVELARESGQWCVLTVKDDGVGLPAGLEAGNRETLGLQLVADLAEQLHGALAVDRVGGTTFTIRFRATDSGA